MQARLVEKEQRLKDVEQENGILIDRWLTYKNEEVERLNLANNFEKEKKAAQKEKTEFLQEQGRAIMEKKVGESILDSGRSQTALVSVRLPNLARKDFTAHQGEANCISFCNSGAKFCTGGADMRIKVC